MSYQAEHFRRPIVGMFDTPASTQAVPKQSKPKKPKQSKPTLKSTLESTLGVKVSAADVIQIAKAREGIAIKSTKSDHEITSKKAKKTK
jgi:hypothetical protein